jgi:hypothetical protein
MKLKSLITVNAVLLIASGIAFTLYGPLVLAFFSVPGLEETNQIGYWQIAAFARLFGATQFGFGLLLFALRGVLSQITVEAQRGIVSALFLANIIGLFTAVTQQVSIWYGYAGWLMAAVFAVFTLLYGYFFFLKRN